MGYRLHQAVWRTWLQASEDPTDAAGRADLVATLGEVDTSSLHAWRTPESFAGAVADSVDRAAYWQAPDEEDVVAALPDVQAALRPVAAAIAAAPGASWWTSPIDLEHQRISALRETNRPIGGPGLTGAAAEKLTEWRRRTITDDQRAKRERPADPSAPYGGAWWSAPVDAGLLSTTRALPSTGAAKLFWEEDSFGQAAAEVWETTVRNRPRVLEIHDSNAWTDLVRRYPLDVTWSRRHEWYRVTGHTGTWIIPDWEAVGHDWDAVHVSVAGYLSTATRPLPVSHDIATMLAGWNPDETYWLTDLLTAAETSPEHWFKTKGASDTDDTWHQATQQADHPAAPLEP